MKSHANVTVDLEKNIKLCVYTSFNGG